MNRPAAILCALCALGVKAQDTPPIPIASTNSIKHYSIPHNFSARTNIELRFDPYTNIWFEVEASTNLADWYHKTNIYVWQTNICFPITQPCEFYRIQTIGN